MLAILAFTIATLTSPDSKAIPAFMQAGQLQALCDIGTDQSDAELCSGYILGSVDQVLAEQDIWGRRRAALCLPADITVDQLRTVVMVQIRQKSDQRDLAAATVVAAALKSSYPCGSRRGGR